MSIEEAVLEKLRVLSPDKQQEVLNFVELLHEAKIQPLTESERQKADRIIARGLKRAMEAPPRPASEIWAEFEAVRARIAANWAALT